MREISLFIAMSLDGYIADSRGSVDWLNGQTEDGEMIDTYSLFVRDVDTVVMGWNTYHQIVTELSPEQWVYEGMKTYVFTHSKHPSSEEICFTDREPEELLRELRQQAGKKIWVCGGANLVGQLREKGMIDEYYISVIPTLLGSGIRLFEEKSTEQRLELVSTQNYNGIVELVYKRRKDPNGVYRFIFYISGKVCIIEIMGKIYNGENEMRRTYLIDSENINDVWVELLQVLEDEDEILVFYTDKSAHMGYDRSV